MRTRIRTVKPEIFADEELWFLEKSTGLPLFRYFIGLWCHADREGRFEWRPLRLGRAILPYGDDRDFGAVLDVLEHHRYVVRYVVNGQQYGYVRTFKRHQAINHKEPQSILPAPTAENVVEPGSSPRVGHASTTRGSPVSDALGTGGLHDPGFPEGNGNGSLERISGTDLGSLERDREPHDLVEGAAPTPTPDLGLPPPGSKDLRLEDQAVPPPKPPRKKSTKTRTTGSKGKTKNTKGTKTEKANGHPTEAARVAAIASFESYADAYAERYGEDARPTGSSALRGMFAHFVKRVPLEEAPAIAYHFVKSNDAYYVRRKHPVKCLLGDAEKIRTEWINGTHSTQTEAFEADRQASRTNDYQEVLERAKQRDAERQQQEQPK